MTDYNSYSTPPTGDDTNETAQQVRDAANDAAARAAEVGKRVGQQVTEQLEITGRDLVDRVKEIVASGNVRRIILRAPDDKVMLEMNLTTATVVGGAITLAAWWLAALGAIAALLARVRIEIVREVPDGAQAVVQEVDTNRKVKVQIEETDSNL